MVMSIDIIGACSGPLCFSCILCNRSVCPRVLVPLIATVGSGVFLGWVWVDWMSFWLLEPEGVGSGFAHLKSTVTRNSGSWSRTGQVKSISYRRSDIGSTVVTFSLAVGIVAV